MYLLATVIIIEEPQYDSTGRIGLFCQLLEGGGARGALGVGCLGGLNRPCLSPSSRSLPSSILFLSSSAILKVAGRLEKGYLRGSESVTLRGWWWNN